MWRTAPGDQTPQSSAWFGVVDAADSWGTVIYSLGPTGGFYQLWITAIPQWAGARPTTACSIRMPDQQRVTASALVPTCTARGAVVTIDPPTQTVPELFRVINQTGERMSLVAADQPPLPEGMSDLVVERRFGSASILLVEAILTDPQTGRRAGFRIELSAPFGSTETDANCVPSWSDVWGPDAKQCDVVGNTITIRD